LDGGSLFEILLIVEKESKWNGGVNSQKNNLILFKKIGKVNKGSFGKI
jgi:hypothetical protein